jgi:hypothetical protein
VRVGFDGAALAAASRVIANNSGWAGGDDAAFAGTGPDRAEVAWFSVTGGLN